MAKKEYQKPLVYVQKENPKKKYTAPKAELYKSADLQKARTSGNNGRSYRRTPSFSGTIGGLVSIILLIGVIATVFIAYSNTQLNEGDSPVYFSPSEYFLRLSSSSQVVYPAGSYMVKIPYSSIAGLINWFKVYGYIEYYGSEIRSINSMTMLEYSLGTEKQFVFVINDTEYTTVTIDDDVTGLYGRELNLPEEVIYSNVMPDIADVIAVWSSVSDVDELVGAFGYTGDFIMRFLSYQTSFLNNLLPWNAFKTVDSSTNIGNDHSPVRIPWLDQNGDYLPPDQVN